jgi:hypothetical protein
MNLKNITFIADMNEELIVITGLKITLFYFGVLTMTLFVL